MNQQQLQPSSIRQSLSVNPNQNQNSYFSLINKVGNNGKYQFRVFLAFALSWIAKGFIFYAMPFLFKRQQFDCQKYGFDQDDCESQICQLNPKNIQSYLKPSPFISMAQQYGPFYCSSSHILFFLRSAPFIGSIVAFIFSIVTDNIGRKLTLMITIPLGLIGAIITSLATSIWMGSIGLFISGIGVAGTYRITGIVFPQITKASVAQKYVIGLQLFYQSMAFLIGVVFTAANNWRFSVTILLTIPLTISLILTIFLFYQTPKFLIANQGSSIAFQKFKDIAQINGRPTNCISLEDVQAVQRQININQQVQNVRTPFDLVKFSSIRMITISIFFIALAKSFINNGPYALIDYIGVNIQVNQSVFGITQLVMVVVAFFTIKYVPRKFLIQVCFGTQILCIGAAALIKRNHENDFSSINIIHLCFYQVARILMAYMQPIYYIYLLQLYPLSVRGMGLGLATTISSFAAVFTQIFFLQLMNSKFKPVYFILIWSVIGLIFTFFLVQTLNKPLKDEIEEIESCIKQIQMQKKSSKLSIKPIETKNLETQNQ